MTRWNGKPVGWLNVISGKSARVILKITDTDNNEKSSVSLSVQPQVNRGQKLQ